jgi:hypothetical protein
LRYGDAEKRKVVKKGVGKQKRNTNRKESNDESEEEISNTDEEAEHEELDCIAVENAIELISRTELFKTLNN